MRSFAALFLSALLLGAPVWGSERYKPGSTSRKGVGSFAGTAASGKAKGEYKLGKTSIDVNLTGLKPGGIYSVSLVKVRPYTTRGIPPTKVTAGADGTAAVTLKVPAATYKAWQLLLVSYFPSGNVKDTRVAKPILRAKL